MRIIVVSDTHGDLADFERVIDRQKNADMFIHLGDCERDVDDIKYLLHDKMILNVSGNCDFASVKPSESETVAAGKKIFFTHGHNYHVKYGINSVIGEARSRKADILLFGHTHIPLSSYEDGLYIMNPGSLGHPREGKSTYGIIDITDAGIVVNIAEL